MGLLDDFWARLSQYAPTPYEDPAPGEEEVICVEAEDMRLHNYDVEHNGKASGDGVIKLSGHKGYASTDFSGASGAYDFTIDFIDENDGCAQIDVFINGVFITCIQLDQQTGDHKNGFRSVTLPGVSLDEGDEITLKGTKNHYEYARIDKLTFTPIEVNEAPIAVDDAATTDEDAAVIISVLSNDTDADNDTLQIVATNDPSNGSIAINDDGTITYTPDSNFSGSDAFSYTVSDGNGGIDTAQVAVEVAPVNDRPEAIDDHAVTDEDTSVIIDVLANDSDPEGDLLVFLTFVSPENGSIDANGDGTITYTPQDDFDGIDSFTYVVSDGNGGTDEAKVTITVNPLQDADADCFETTESAPVHGNVLDNDNLPGEMSVTAVDGGTVGTEFSVTSDGGRTGTLLIEADGTLSFTPSDEFEDLAIGQRDTVTLSYEVSGTIDGGSTKVKTIDFEGLGRGTVVDAQFDGVKISAQRKWARDHCNDAMIFDSTHPTGGDRDLGYAPEQGNLLIISEDNDSHDPDDNAHGGKILFDFDEPTTVTSLTFIDIEEGAYIYLYNDAGHRISKISVHSTKNGGARVQDIDVDDVAKMKVILNGSGAVDDLVYQREADLVVTDTATIKIDVVGENDPPVAINDPFQTNEDTPLSGNVLENDNDIDGDPLTVSAVDGGVIGEAFEVGSVGGNIGQITVLANGDITFDPSGGFEDLNDGETDLVELTYTVSDGAGGTDTAAIAITVGGITDNRPPAIVEPIVLFADENQTSAGALNGFDPDVGDVLTWTITGGDDEAFFNIDPSTGEVSFLAAPDFETPLDADGDNRYALQITLSDGQASVTENVLVNVVDLDENTAPCGVPDIVDGTEDAPFGANLLDNDQDDEGDALSIIEIGGGGIVGVPFEVFTDGLRVVSVTVDASGEILIDPDGRFEDLGEGDVDGLTFAYQIADAGGLVGESSVSVVINGANDAPVFGSSDEFVLPEGLVDVGSILASDAEDDPIVYSIEGGVDADAFEIDPVSGALTFVIVPDFEQALDDDGDNVFEITVGANDGTALTTDDILIFVTEVNDPPSFTSFVDETITGPENVDISTGTASPGIRFLETGDIGQLFAFDSNGDTLVFSKTGGADEGFFDIDPETGVISAAAGVPFNGSADGDNFFEVIFQVSDDSGEIDTLVVEYSLITGG